jgi:hypothetical protein
VLRRVVLAIAAACLAAPFATAAPVDSTHPALAVGKWRVFTARVDYDAGGSDFVTEPSSRPPLLIHADGTWKCGTTSGTWAVSRITLRDWRTWQQSPYGPTAKIVLSGWGGGTGRALGPLEESGGRIKFLWVIYHAKPPVVPAPGLLHLKLSR